METIPIVELQWEPCLLRKKITIWDAQGKRPAMQCGRPDCEMVAKEVSPLVCVGCPLRVLPEPVPEPSPEAAKPKPENEQAPGPEESRGLGDSVKKLTTAIGITPCAGCKQRADWLNWLFPYKRKRRKAKA